MANWFEDNPVKSILGHTFLVAATAWTASTFFSRDYWTASMEAQIAAKKAEAEQYKTKVDLLSQEVSSLKEQNKEYLNWLGQTKDALPTIMPRIQEAQARAARAEQALSQLRSERGLSERIEQAAIARVDEAYIDNSLGLIISVRRVKEDSTAQMEISYRGAKVPVPEWVKPGTQVKISDNPSVTATIKSIWYLSDRVEINVVSGGAAS